MEMEKKEKIAKLAKGVASLAGVVGMAVFAIYWLDLDDAMIRKMEPKLKAKSEAYRAQMAADAAQE